MPQQPATGLRPPELLSFPLPASSPVNKAAVESTHRVKGHDIPVWPRGYRPREEASCWGAELLLGPGLPPAEPQHPECTKQTAAGTERSEEQGFCKRRDKWGRLKQSITAPVTVNKARSSLPRVSLCPHCPARAAVCLGMRLHGHHHEQIGKCSTSLG